LANGTRAFADIDSPWVSALDTDRGMSAAIRTPAAATRRRAPDFEVQP
jgi:hypothetical protein